MARDLTFDYREVSVKVGLSFEAWLKLPRKHRIKYIIRNRGFRRETKRWVLYCPQAGKFITRKSGQITFCDDPSEVCKGMQRDGKNGIRKLLMGNADRWRTQLQKQL